MCHHGCLSLPVCAGVCLSVYPLHAAVHAHAVVSARPQPAHVRRVQALPATLHAQHWRVRAQERRAVCRGGDRCAHHHRGSCASWWAQTNTHTLSDKLVHWGSLRCSGFCTAHSPVYVFVTNVLTGFSPSPRIFHISLTCWHTLPHQSCLSHCLSLHQNAFLLSPPYTLTWLPWTAALIQVWFCQRSLPCKRHFCISTVRVLFVVDCLNFGELTF